MTHVAHATYTTHVTHTTCIRHATYVTCVTYATYYTYVTHTQVSIADYGKVYLNGAHDIRVMASAVNKTIHAVLATNRGVSVQQFGVRAAWSWNLRTL